MCIDYWGEIVHLKRAIENKADRVFKRNMGVRPRVVIYRVLLPLHLPDVMNAEVWRGLSHSLRRGHYRNFFRTTSDPPYV